MAGERQCLWFWMLREAEREQELRRDKFFFKDIAGPVGKMITCTKIREGTDSEVAGANS